LAWLRKHSPDTSRILLTGFADFESLVAAINEGGVGYFQSKPWEPAQLEAVVKEAIEKNSLLLENRSLSEALKRRNLNLERENRSLRKTGSQGNALDALLGSSEPITKLKERILALAASQSTVLITGESGTGKELAARALHFAGERQSGPFVAQNCAALPESILESELFGYVKGAFTHATENRAGIVESAHQGTLFLDEIGDMPLSMQAKLLRFLQEGVVTPVGSRTEKKSMSVSSPLPIAI
jgi:two-component system response regulator HupR/HoxA